jgi:hypothetical protein
LVGLAAVAQRAQFGFTHPQIADISQISLNALPHLTLGAFTEVILAIADYLSPRGTKGGGPLSGKGDRYDIHQRLQTGWHFIQNGEAGLDRFFRQLLLHERARPDVKRHYGLQRDFGPFYAFIATQNREPWLTVRTRFQTYLRTEWDGATVVRRRSLLLDGRAAPCLRFLSKAAVSRSVGRSQPKSQALLCRSSIKSRNVGSWRGAPNFFDRHELDSIAADGIAPLDLAQARRHLGLSYRQFQRLLAEGVLTPIVGPCIDSSKTYAFRAADLNSLIADIAGHIPQSPSTRAKVRTLQSVLNGALRQDIAATSVLTAMREGTLAAVGMNPESPGLSAFLFESAAVKALFARLCEDAIHSADGIPVSAASQLTGVATMSVIWLLRRGVLSEARSSTPRRIRICAQSLDLFQRTLVTCTKLTEEFGTNRKRLTGILRSNNVHPIVDPRESRYGTAVYRRTDIIRRDIETRLRKLRKN